jgi:hypothetical protein
MEFTSSVVGSLAWPTCVLLIVLALRRGLINMLVSGPLKALKAGPSGLELEYFDRTLTDAKVNAGLPAENPRKPFWRRMRTKVSAAPLDSSEQREYAFEDMKHLAKMAPAAAILESFGRLEKTLRDKMNSLYEHDVTSRGPWLELVTLADVHGVLTGPEARSVRELGTLRNALAHGEGRNLVDQDRALSYVEVVERLSTRIQHATVRESDPESDDKDVDTEQPSAN